MPATTPPAPYVGFRALDGLAAELTARADDGQSLGMVARRDLERYYELLRRSLPTFSVAQASLIVDAANGTLWEPHSIPLLWAEVHEAIRRDDLSRRWGVDGEALVRRLRDDLTPFHLLAIADASERYWRLVSGPDASAHEDALRRVGLLR